LMGVLVLWFVVVGRPICKMVRKIGRVLPRFGERVVCTAHFLIIYGLNTEPDLKNIGIS